MSRVRSSMVLLGICVAALLVGVLQLTTQRTPLPTGSSYSSDLNGAQALFTWANELGVAARRTPDIVIPVQAPTTLVVLQPESPIDSEARTAFDAVPEHGGMLVVAGDSLQWLLYVRELGVIVDTARPELTPLHTTDSMLTFGAVTRYRLRSTTATPLLLTADGAPVALKMPYKQGSLVVISSPAPLLNETLRDQNAARFVYREIVAPAATAGGLLFDEAHHSYVPPSRPDAPVTADDLLFRTSPGRALVYAGVLTFLFVVLSGRRLGPALPAQAPNETRRTMFEHVQMLANLYRRAGQLGAARAAFARHYARVLTHAGHGSTHRTAALAEALRRIETARTESDLIDAVGAASDAG